MLFICSETMITLS